MKDTAFTPLLSYLQHADKPTLWFADENALALVKALSGKQPLLHIATNRYDIYQLARAKGFSCEFNDFCLHALPQAPERIVYRISKEKPLSHYLLNQAAKLLASNGELLISGQKQEGVKTYGDKLKKVMGCRGELKKNGRIYSGHFSGFSPQKNLDDQDYSQLQQLTIDHPAIPTIYTKPGVFGWNKIDQGTELLLQYLPAVFSQQCKDKASSPCSVLDLGCGYGWIFLNLPHCLPASVFETMTITATDNNAAALICAQKNAQAADIQVEIIPSDCADGIQKKFDIVLCNPPFHQGFSHDKALIEKFLQQTSLHLNNGGIALFVVNEFIQFPAKSLTLFSEATELGKENGFKVILLRHR